MHDYNRLNLEHPDYETNLCSDPDSKLCGSDLTDSYYRYCYPQNVTCPINGIQIVMANDSVRECFENNETCEGTWRFLEF